MATEENLERGLLDCSDFGEAAGVVDLLARGARTDAINDEGYNALMLAARYGSVECVNALIDAGASLDAVSPADGSSALMLAAKYGNVDCVKALLIAGANVSLIDTEGNTAADAARLSHQEGCKAVLFAAKIRARDVHPDTAPIPNRKPQP